MTAKSFQSAVVVIPPERLWPQIQDVRKKHDESYELMMPHMKLLYPFVKIDATGSNLRKAVDSIYYELRKRCKPGGTGTCARSFKVHFTKDSIQHIDHGRISTIYLKPLLPQGNPKESRSIARKRCRNSAESGHSKAKKKTRVSRWDDVDKSQNIPPVEVVDIRQLPTHFLDQQASPVQKDFGFNMEPPVPPEFRDLPAPSLSSLREAFWTDKDILEDRSWRHGVGIPASFDYSGVNISGKADENMNKSSHDDDSTDDEVVTVCGKKKHIVWSSDDDTDNDSTLEDPKTFVHPNLKELQTMLLDLYPELVGPLSRNSWRQQPHISLGLFKNKDVAKILAELKKNWDDIVFSVDEIFIISRPNSFEPFKVKETIKLCR